MDFKVNDKIILEKDNKKLYISVQVSGNLDFYMYLGPRTSESSTFIIDDGNPNLYFATAQLFDNLINEYNVNTKFYKKRYEAHPVYNEKLEMFKFHSDDSNINDNDFTRFFKKDGKYYIVFNKDNKTLRLSNSGSRYPTFVKYFNKYYSTLVKYYENNNFNVDNKVKKYEEQKNG
ncbi:MAG: hypothetical protein IJO32_00995 [Bacilli bacterium]|nr:hypothetical protein [Bacilli bacterium]